MFLYVLSSRVFLVLYVTTSFTLPVTCVSCASILGACKWSALGWPFVSRDFIIKLQYYYILLLIHIIFFPVEPRLPGCHLNFPNKGFWREVLCPSCCQSREKKHQASLFRMHYEIQKGNGRHCLTYSVQRFFVFSYFSFFSFWVVR